MYVLWERKEISVMTTREASGRHVMESTHATRQVGGVIVGMKRNNGSKRLSAQHIAAPEPVVVVHVLRHHLLQTKLCALRCIVLTPRTSEWDPIWRSDL